MTFTDIVKSSGPLRYGQNSQNVGLLQFAVGVNQDNQFGTKTLRAVQAYQSAHGLTADGIVGLATAARLDGAPTPSPPNVRVSNVIDISHWNDIQDFGLLKAAGVLGVVSKCTQGASGEDVTYAPRRKLAINAGLLWGAYTFNTGESIPAQIDNFFLHANPDANTLMCLDFEDNPTSQMSLNQAKLFLQMADAKLGRKCVLYSGNRIKDLLGSTKDAFFASHRLWLAQYGPRPVLQASWDNYWLWQYSETGKMPGTDSKLDLNFYPGTSDQLKKEWAS